MHYGDRYSLVARSFMLGTLFAILLAWLGVSFWRILLLAVIVVGCAGVVVRRRVDRVDSPDPHP